MHIDLERIEDKIECFEANDLQILEQKINQKIDINKALLLEVANIHYQVPCIQKTINPITRHSSISKQNEPSFSMARFALF